MKHLSCKVDHEEMPHRQYHGSSKPKPSFLYTKALSLDVNAKKIEKIDADVIKVNSEIEKYQQHEKERRAQNKKDRNYIQEIENETRHLLDEENEKFKDAVQRLDNGNFFTKCIEMRENIDADHQLKLLEGEIEELEYKISDAQEEISLKKREIELRKSEVENAKKIKQFSGKLIGLNLSSHERLSYRNSRNETIDTFTGEGYAN